MTAGRGLSPFPLYTFDRYLLREFLRFFILSFAGFVGFTILFDLFEKIDVFIDNSTPLRLILEYYFYATPYKAVLVTPVALLLATFLSLGYMTRFQELTIVKSSGVSITRTLIPLYVMGVLISLGSFAVTDFVMPGAQTRARELLEQDIKGRTLRNLGSRINVNYIGEDNRFFIIRRYDVPRRTMNDLVIQEYDGDRLQRRIDARAATWVDGAWEIVDGVDRTFLADGREHAAPFDTLALALPENPEDFAKEKIKPEQMSYPALKRYVDRVRSSGSKVEQFETDLHLRLAYPLVNFVVIFLAASLAVQLRRGGIAIGFGLSLAIAFVYWSAIRAGQVLGHNGTLPPVLAAWLGNILFIGFGIWLLARTPK